MTFVTVELVEQHTPPIENDFVLVIAEDGSDSSYVLRSLISKYSNIASFQYDRRMGRGWALREAWKNVNADKHRRRHPLGLQHDTSGVRSGQNSRC